MVLHHFTREDAKLFQQFILKSLDSVLDPTPKTDVSWCLFLTEIFHFIFAKVDKIRTEVGKMCKGIFLRLGFIAPQLLLQKKE